jgi:hypothetical protein
VRSLVGQLHIDYPVLVGSQEELIGDMEKLGDTQGALPYSLLVNPAGMVVYRQLGAFGDGELAPLIEKYLPAATTVSEARNDAQNGVILAPTASK